MVLKQILFTLLIIPVLSMAQNAKPDSLNTAKDAAYMNALEREMIYEINCLRNNPKSYLQYITPLLAEAQKKVTQYGKGPAWYSVRFTTTYSGQKETTRIDTIWHFEYEEEAHALSTLAEDLTKWPRLSILQPDKGIYLAAVKHANDQNKHHWKLMHTGSDKSEPWDRIKKFSPKMKDGNENIAGNSNLISARQVILQLLIDKGISDYGHRYNILDQQWTHMAIKETLHQEGMNWWLQEFGKIAK